MNYTQQQQKEQTQSVDGTHTHMYKHQHIYVRRHIHTRGPIQANSEHIHTHSSGLDSAVVLLHYQNAQMHVEIFNTEMCETRKRIKNCANETNSHHTEKKSR